MQEPVGRNLCVLLGVNRIELPALFHLYVTAVKASTISPLYLKNGEDLKTLAGSSFTHRELSTLTATFNKFNGNMGICGDHKCCISKVFEPFLDPLFAKGRIFRVLLHLA